MTLVVKLFGQLQLFFYRGNKMAKSKTFFLDQHGCAKNQVDGEIIITRLVNLGFVQASNADDADLIIVNSCGFIESAKKESLLVRRWYLGRKEYCSGTLFPQEQR